MTTTETGAPDAVLAAVLAAPFEKRVAMLTRLAFAAAERPRGASARRLRRLFRAHLDEVVEGAAAVARQSGPPMTDLLAAAIRRHGTVGTARRVIAVLGEGKGRVTELDVVCRRLIVDDVLAAGVDGDPAGAVDAAADLVERLHDLGRPHAGIAVLRRFLAAFRRAELATPLSLMCQLGALLIATGDHRRAETILLKALDSAAKAGLPAWQTADDWINLATVRSKLLDTDGALDAVRRAIALLECSPDDDPRWVEERDFLLGTALSNGAVILLEAGDVDAAADAVRKALSLNERLAARDPDVHAPRLVETLINASHIMATQGDVATARACSGRAVAEAQRLPAATLAAHGGAMVSGMINHAIDLERLGETEHAMEMATEAAALAGRLVDAFGDRFLPSAAEAEGTVCNIGLQGGYLTEARAAGERAMTLSARLPLDDMGLNALVLLPNLSDVYAKLGKRRAALEAATQAYRLLREGEVGEGRYRIDHDARIGVRDIYAQRLAEEGKTAEAVAIVREAVAIAAEPPDGTVSAMPAHSLVHLANMLADLGDLDGALTAAAEAVGILDRLSAYDPGWAEEELPTALHTHANILWQAGDTTAARTVLDRAVALNRRRIGRDERGGLADLAAALEFSAILANRAGDVDRAGLEIGEAVALYERLVAESGEGFVSDLANGLHNAAMIAMTANALEDAIALQHRAADMLDRLPQKDVNERRQVADSLVNLGLYYAMAGRVADGLASVERVPDLIGELATDWLPARQSLTGAAVARSRLLVMAGRHDEAAACAGTALAAMAAAGQDFWRGPALVNRAMALAALGSDDAPAAAREALDHHRRGLDSGNADDLHGYCDAAAVILDLAAVAGGVIDGQVHDLLAPLPAWFERMGPDRGGVAAVELVRALEEHCGGVARWPEFHRRT
ncbi:hypothetical protein [Azospirillum sp. sgz302134]